MKRHLQACAKRRQSFGALLKSQIDECEMLLAALENKAELATPRFLPNFGRCNVAGEPAPVILRARAMGMGYPSSMSTGD